MASSNIYRNTAYGFSQGLLPVSPIPVTSLRAPTTGDKGFEIGTIWVYKTINAAYILTSIVNNSATWVNVGGAAGVFTSLTVNPGPTSITGQFTLTAGTNTVSIGADAADHQIVIGNSTGSSALTLTAGTGNMLLQTAATGAIFVGAADMTGNIQIGSSAAGQAVFLSGAINTGAQSVNIATGASAANSTVNILTGNATAGIQTFNVLTGTRAGVVNIATGAAANAVTIGTKTGIAATGINSGTGGTFIETAVTGNINIGTVAMTGPIAVGLSTAGQTINIGNAVNVGAQVINIASGAAAAITTVNILNGINTAGSQNLNIMNGGGGSQAGTVNIGTGTAAHTVRVGSSTGAATTTIIGGTGGVVLSAPFVLLSGGVHIYTGAGAPAGGLALQTGDLYINTTAATAATRLYIATGAGAWTFFTANA